MLIILQTIVYLMILYCLFTICELAYITVQLFRRKNIEYMFNIGPYYHHVVMRHYKHPDTGKDMVDLTIETGKIEIKL